MRGVAVAVAFACVGVGGVARTEDPPRTRGPISSAFEGTTRTGTRATAVLDAAGTLGPVSARVALQVGLTPDTYHQAEPIRPLARPTSAARSPSSSGSRSRRRAGRTRSPSG